MSRLWKNPPLKPDGTLDYARLTLAEICEDLTESLLDRVYNSGDRELVPYLNDLPEVDKFTKESTASDVLVETMEELLRQEDEDAAFRSPGARVLLGRAVLELREAANIPD